MSVGQLAAGRWAPTLLVCVVLAIGGVCLWNGTHRIGQPFPGFLVSENRIVLSIGRRGWSVENAERIRFAKVIAIEGRPLAASTDIDAYVAAVPVGSPVSYRFRKEAEVFTAQVTVRRFGLDDFFCLYAMYFLIGGCFAVAGYWVLRRTPTLPASGPFFVLCQTAGLALVTGGDVYGPHWFTSLYFTAHCLTPATLLHFTSNFPEPLVAPRSWRRFALSTPYAGALLIAVALNRVADEPSLFLPLIYTVYLFLANVILLYLGRLVIAWWTIADPALQRSVRRALLGLFLSASVPGAIFVIYPALKEPISPILLVAPLVVFPLCTASALHLASGTVVSPGRSTARQRLGLLFLGAVETAFLAGIAVFWLSNSWQELLDDVMLNQHQLDRVERFLAAPLTLDHLTAIDALVQTIPEQDQVAGASGALARHDEAAARAPIEHLAAHYRAAGQHLAARRQGLERLDAALVLILVVAGIVESAGFMIAIRRWLIAPIEQLSVATNVIATGDLAHRVSLAAASEFSLLADSINTMAASLAAIQERIRAEQEARRGAAGAARDAERRRLARELHDGTLQDLSAVKLQLEAAARVSRQAHFQEAIDATIEIIVGLRRIIDDLGAPDLGYASLRQAIASYAHALAEAHGVTLALDLRDTAQVPEWATRDVYRIAQEALGNAIRHGAPSHLSVQLSAAAGPTELQIIDDGCGFDMRTVALGTGIRGMQERAAAIGAALHIVAAPRRGTQVRLTLAPAPTVV